METIQYKMRLMSDVKLECYGGSVGCGLSAHSLHGAELLGRKGVGEAWRAIDHVMIAEYIMR